MFDSQEFHRLLKEYAFMPISFVFYDRFSKKFGPLNVSSNIKDCVYTASNFLKSVEDKNISLHHIDVYIIGSADVENASYDFFSKPVLFFNGSDYKEAYNTVLDEVQDV